MFGAPIRSLQPRFRHHVIRLVGKTEVVWKVVKAQQSQRARRADLRASVPHQRRPLPMQVLNTYQRNSEDGPTTRQTPTLRSLLMCSARPVGHPTYLRIQKRFGRKPE